jgi:hypothetical protein
MRDFRQAIARGSQFRQILQDVPSRRIFSDHAAFLKIIRGTVEILLRKRAAVICVTVGKTVINGICAAAWVGFENNNAPWHSI